MDLNQGICSKIGDALKEEDIDPELRGSMPEVSEMFDDKDRSHNDKEGRPSPEEGTDDPPLSLIMNI